MTLEPHEYEISDETSRLDRARVESLLSRSYWAATRTPETIERSLRKSINYGVYHGGQQVAFARVVTDEAVMFWLCDVVVLESHRGQGLGKALVEHVLGDPRLAGLVGILATKDAHGLYERFGFVREGQRLMVKMPPMERGVPAHVTASPRPPAS